MSADPVIDTSAITSYRAWNNSCLAALNTRFNGFMQKVHNLHEQNKSIENANLVAYTHQMDREIRELGNMYEKELNNVRQQLDDMTHKAHSYEPEANKYALLSTDLEKKFSDETNMRKKLEVALGDAHRMLNEQKANNYELQVSLAETQNSHLDTSTELSNTQGSLVNITSCYDVEAATRKELEAANHKLANDMKFQEEKHLREVNDLKYRINAAEHAIKIAEDRLKEHNVVDEQLAHSFAKMKVQNHNDLVRYQEEAEYTYQASLASMKKQIDTQTKALNEALQENIRLKAIVDDQKSKLSKTDSKCSTAEQTNNSLINQMESERSQATSQILALEAKQRDMKDEINSLVRQLNHVYHANIPANLEIQAFSGLLDAEERRLAVKNDAQASDLYNRVRPFHGRWAYPISPRYVGARPKTTPAAATTSVEAPAAAKDTTPSVEVTPPKDCSLTALPTVQDSVQPTEEEKSSPAATELSPRAPLYIKPTPPGRPRTTAGLLRDSRVNPALAVTGMSAYSRPVLSNRKPGYVYPGAHLARSLIKH